MPDLNKARHRHVYSKIRWIQHKYSMSKSELKGEREKRQTWVLILYTEINPPTWRWNPNEFD